MNRFAFSTVVAFFMLLGCDTKDKGSERAATKAGIAAPKAPSAEVTPDAQAEKSAPPLVPATRIETENFSAPIPAGYTLASAQRVGQLGQQFGQKVEALLTRGTSSTSLRESIFITRLSSQELNPSSIAQCRKSSQDMIRVTGATVAEKAAIVDYPFGKTCQFALASGKTHTIQSFAYVGGMLWTVTCKTTTLRRKAGTVECSELLRGFTK